MKAGRVMLCLLAGATLVFAGCGGDGGDAGSLSGDWYFLLNFTWAKMNLQEDGSGNLTGTFEWIGHSAMEAQPTSLNGTITGASVSLTIDFDNGSVTTITAALDGDRLVGGASTQSPGTATPSTEDFVATREPPPDQGINVINGHLDGVWEGTFTDPTYGDFSNSGAMQLDAPGDGTFTCEIKDNEGNTWVLITGTVHADGSIEGSGSASFPGNVQMEGSVEEAGSGRLTGGGSGTSKDGWRGASGDWTWHSN